MMFRTIAALSALGLASASQPIEIDGNINANSKLGSRILSSAKQLTPGRNLDQEAGYWVAGYSIKFEKCATSDEYYGGDLGGEQNDQQQWNNMYKQRLVHFKLCPTQDGCSSCTYGADYVIDMGVFVEAYIESKMDAQEYDCEMVRENCDCENANDDEACEYQCYVSAGLDYCEQDNQNNNNNENQVEFELQEAAECRELDVDDEALQYYYYQQNVDTNANQQYYQGNNNQQQEMKLFVGPYCSANGKQIYLGTFMDEMCSYPAPEGTYEKFSYGQALPYSDTTLIDNECVSCKEPQDYNENNNGDQEDADEVIEICERLYEDAAKCESGLADGVTYYPNTYGCDFISSLKAPGKMNSSKSAVSASKVFAGLFAVTTLAFAGVAYHLFQKSRRNNVDLSSNDGAAMA